jgi:hypothetical protein
MLPVKVHLLMFSLSDTISIPYAFESADKTSAMLAFLNAKRTGSLLFTRIG